MSRAYTGDFDWLWERLEGAEQVILLAAGTGLTPMLSVVCHYAEVLGSGDGGGDGGEDGGGDGGGDFSLEKNIEKVKTRYVYF